MDIITLDYDDIDASDLASLVKFGASADRNEERVFQTVLDDTAIFISASTIKDAIEFVNEECPPPHKSRWIQGDFKEIKLS